MMSKLDQSLKKHVVKLTNEGRAKGREWIIRKVHKGKGRHGTRYEMKGCEKSFIRMNSNSYLGLSLYPDIVSAEEKAAAEFGVGPGAVRFISGSFQAHIDLEKKLAAYHSREASMLFSSAYVTTLGVISSLVTKTTAVISDELNHNCIINAIRMARPAEKMIYAHNNMQELSRCLKNAKAKADRILVITDGVFSMRGDYAPLHEIRKLCDEAAVNFKDGVSL